MNRRSFIRSLAAAVPAGAVATQIKAETDPVKAAYLTLRHAVERGAPEGMEVSGDIVLFKDNVLAHAFPADFKAGDQFGKYESKTGWVLKT